MDQAPSRATLQRNIKGITEGTWEEVNHILLAHAAGQGVEGGARCAPTAR